MPWVVLVEGAPDHPINRGTLCPKGTRARLIKPQVRPRLSRQLHQRGVRDSRVFQATRRRHPDVQFTVEAAILYDSHQRTPYLGSRLRGVIERTYLRGHRINERGKAIEQPFGRMLARQR